MTRRVTSKSLTRRVTSKSLTDMTPMNEMNIKTNVFHAISFVSQNDQLYLAIDVPKTNTDSKLIRDRLKIIRRLKEERLKEERLKELRPSFI